MQIREIAIVGVFSALAYAGGYVTILIPNVEFFTSIIFLSGLLFGKRIGALVGCIAALAYGLINPNGISTLPLLTAQVLSRVLVGFVGGLLSQSVIIARPFWVRSVIYGVAAFCLLSLYNLFAGISDALTYGYSFQQFRVYLISGFYFYLLSYITNIIVFSFILPWIVPILRNNPSFKEYSAA